MIKIFDRVNKEIPSKLLMVGDGPERIQVEQLSRELGLDNRVKFLGKLRVIENILAISDIFVLPSETESFGLVALEAAACGTPVVAASVGGLQDLVLHGTTGYLVNERDPKLYAHYARQILENPLHGAEIAMNAVEKAQQYSWEKTSDQILNLYTSVTTRALVDCR